jgi:hypothetical protein
MMHPYSPGPRWLAVPGIGFPQNISVGSNVLDLEDFRDWSLTERRKADSQHEASSRDHSFRPDAGMAAVERTCRSI